LKNQLNEVPHGIDQDDAIGNEKLRSAMLSHHMLFPHINEISCQDWLSRDLRRRYEFTVKQSCCSWNIRQVLPSYVS